MKITVNGKQVDLREGISLEEWLRQEKYDKPKIAVEINGEIVPKAQYEGYVLGEGDKLEVVAFVGGG